MRQLGKWRMDESRDRCHVLDLKAIIGSERNSIMMSKAMSKTEDECSAKRIWKDIYAKEVKDDLFPISHFFP